MGSCNTVEVFNLNPLIHKNRQTKLATLYGYIPSHKVRIIHHHKIFKIGYTYAWTIETMYLVVVFEDNAYTIKVAHITSDENVIYLYDLQACEKNEDFVTYTFEGFTNLFRFKKKLHTIEFKLHKDDEDAVPKLHFNNNVIDFNFKTFYSECLNLNFNKCTPLLRDFLNTDGDVRNKTVINNIVINKAINVET